ncbi:hypothetical protein [Microlunatus ginsengisoli]|uniref:Uncharacterized protein n=1 Tax=Microlunatus ginsengisoli TaxID=363863 RepID=A0ABP6ZLQ4_9ACTN
MVVEDPRIVEDEFDHAEVVRLVIDVDGGEEGVDLSEDDLVYRLVAAKRGSSDGPIVVEDPDGNPVGLC